MVKASARSVALLAVLAWLHTGGSCGGGSGGGGQRRR